MAKVSIAVFFLLTRAICRSLIMAVPPDPYQQPRNSNTLIILAVIVVAVLVLGGAILAFMFYTPARFLSSTSSNSLQDPSVTSATLTCTGTCNITAHFYSDYSGASAQIAQDGPLSSTIQRSSSAIYWDIEWRITLQSTGTISITLNTGFVVSELQGPISNQGSWTTSTGQH